MTEQEFTKRIAKCRDNLINYHNFGVCNCLHLIFKLNARQDFNNFFSGDSHASYWLNDFFNQDDNMDALTRRLMFLDMFEEWSICYETYLGY